MKFKALHAQPIKQGKAFSKVIAKKEGKGKPQRPKKSLENFNPSMIQNKQKRQEVFYRRKKEMGKLKRQRRKQNKIETEQNGRPKLMPLTTDDKREIDENFIAEPEEDQELVNEEQNDEFAGFFNEGKPPKIMMTTSERPSRQMFEFLKEMKTVFSEAHYWPRKQFSIKEIQQYAINKEYTDIIVFREDKKDVNEIIMIHLPEGPTVHFKITSVKLSSEIHNVGRVTDHNPELVLNNFNTKVGRRVGRFFSSLFPQNPDFRGRRVVTFHNQRDFIFFRHHRYMFQDEGIKVALQEIGPRMTLKVKKVQLGLFDNAHGEIEFEATDEMYVSKRRVYI